MKEFELESSKFQALGVLTSQESWFVPYAKQLVRCLQWQGYEVALGFSHTTFKRPLDVVFILSYFRRVPQSFLQQNAHNLVVHESALPQGRGWAPLFWQILEGKSKIPIVLFEAVEELDAGPIWLTDWIELDGHELYAEIREKQAHKTLELCMRFLKEYDQLQPMPQQGTPTYYSRRTPEDSKLDLDKTLREQFNLLRIVDNEKFPAFFVYKGHKYIVKIFKEGKSE